MTFRELLKAKDAACDELELAESMLTEAQDAVNKATEDFKKALTAREDADKAIVGFLTDRGATSLTDKDGTVSYYTLHDGEIGWQMHHPVSGDVDFAKDQAAVEEAVA